MILSLEDEEEPDLQDVTQNVITVDDEYLNGPMLGRSQLFLGCICGTHWDLRTDAQNFYVLKIRLNLFEISHRVLKFEI